MSVENLMENFELLGEEVFEGRDLAGGQPRGKTEHDARMKCPGKADARQQEVSVRESDHALRQTGQSNPTRKRSLHAADGHNLKLTTRYQNRKSTVQVRSCKSRMRPRESRTRDWKGNAPAISQQAGGHRG